MKIVYLTSVDPSAHDAAAVHVQGTCKSLSALGHKVLLIHPGPTMTKPVRLDWVESQICCWWPPLRGGYRIFDWLAVQSLRKVVRSWHPDVIYLRFGASRRLARTIKLLSVPTAIEINGVEFDSNDRSLATIRSSDLILVDTDRMREVFVDRNKDLENRVHVHETFVTDPEKFRPLDRDDCCHLLGLSPDCIRIVHTSSFQSWHDFQTIVDAVLQLEGKSEKDIEVVFVGNGPLKANLEKTLTQRLGGIRFRFPGSVEHEKIALYLGASDIALDLFTRSRLENGKNMGAYKLYEYAVCNKPIVTAVSEDFVPPDWARDNFALIPPEDPQALAAAIGRIIHNPLEWAKKAATAGDYVRANLNWDRATRTTLVHLERLIAENGTALAK